WLHGRIPVWLYACGPLRIESRIWMEHRENTSYVAWRLAPDFLVPDQVARLKVRLLVNARDAHATTRPSEFKPVVEASGAELRVIHPDWFTLYVIACGGALTGAYDWYDNFDLSVERARGLPDRGSPLCAGVADLTLHPG